MRGQLLAQSRTRAGIARRMVESKQQVPHFYVQTEIATDLLGTRLAELNSDESDARVTMTSALVRACVTALREHRRFNSVWTREGLLESDEINVGIAIAFDEGVLAPALLAVDRLDVQATAAALRDLAGRARSGRLRPAEISDATFTLSNLGMFDVSAFTAIITPPQVAVLATAQPVERLVIGSDRSPEVRSFLTATLSADHRAVDGVDAARFLETFKRSIEDPDRILARESVT